MKQHCYYSSQQRNELNHASGGCRQYTSSWLSGLSQPFWYKCTECRSCTAQQCIVRIQAIQQVFRHGSSALNEGNSPLHELRSKSNILLSVEVVPGREQIRCRIDRVSERCTKMQNLPKCMKILESKHVLRELCLTCSN
ncbi:TPA: hypothetical protein ACH3X2_009472 [Trebouxia sp. C0005]